MTLRFAASAMRVDVPSPPVGEGDSAFQQGRWGEGLEQLQETPHLIEFVDVSVLPSPTRGEGAVTVILARG